MNKRKIGAVQVLLAAVSWSFAGVFCKWLPWSSYTIIGLRSLFSAIILGLARGGFRMKITRGNLMGALGMAVTSFLFLSATKLTTSANAIVLQYAMPVVVIALCWIFYHRRPSRLDVVTALCVLCGVILCSWEGLTGGGGKLTGDILAIASAFSYALVFFSARLPDANTQDYVYLGATLTIPFMFYAPFDPAMTLNPVHWLAIVAMAICLAGGYYFISKSLNNVHPVTSALLANLEPVLNPLWVFIFLGENPGVYTLVGAVVVIVAVSIYSVLDMKHE